MDGKPSNVTPLQGYFSGEVLSLNRIELITYTIANAAGPT